MKNSSLEITEKEYLIKLNRNDFDISFIKRLLKGIQSENCLSDSKTIPTVDYPDNMLSNDYLSNRFDCLRDK